VDALECEAGKDRVFLWDEALAGFGVAAFPSGKKVYVAQYRKDGLSRRVTIGDHGRLTPNEARSEAKTILGAVEKGADPVKLRRDARAVRTFGQVAEEFMLHHVAAKRKAHTLASYQEVLAKHVLPTLRNRRIMDLTRGDLIRLHTAMHATPSAANRTLAVVSSVWNWAAQRDEVLAGANPCRGIERYAQRRSERFLTTDELARLGDVLRRAETEGLPWKVAEGKPTAKHAPKLDKRHRMLDPFAVAAIRLLILTGARLREILHAKWEHVDFERGIIHLPDSKTGAKPIYLSAAAQAILSGLPRIQDNPYIIPGQRLGAPRADLKKPWAAATKAAGLPSLRIHDLRHSFASFGAGASLGLPIIGKLLGHAQAATTHRYAHLDADPMRRAVETIGAGISAALEGKPAAQIVPLKHRA
jgi:integrase